jgi:hypothetical protein
MQDLDQFFSSLISPKQKPRHPEEVPIDSIMDRYRDISVWRSVAHVLLIQRQTCACGSVHEFSQGEFLRQEHLRARQTFRLVHNDVPLGLPKSIEYHDSAISICANCAKDWK